MTTIYCDQSIDDDSRRAGIYDGDLYVYSATAATTALCELARELSEQAFAPYDPREAQYELPVERYVEILRELKPRFIHHPDCKILIPTILDDLGCDLDKTFFDLPRLRTATSHGYLTTGLGYAFKPHRDTWYSTPMCQINWWLPVYPIETTNAMSFHLHYWKHPLKNSSAEFNYQEWNRSGRAVAAKQVGKDTRRQSRALEPIDLEPELRVITKQDGLLVFSAAHLHSTVPNTSGKTRFSIDFRTVHINELWSNEGAPNLDSQSSGTTIRDYIRAADCAPMPDEVRALYETCTPTEEELSPQLRSG